MAVRKSFLLACVCAAGFGITVSDVLRPVESAVLDSQFRLLRAVWPKPVRSDVVIVGIDEGTVAEFPEPQALWHEHLSQLFSALALGRPAVVGVDLVLPDRSYDRVLPGADRALAMGLVSLRSSAPIVLGVTVGPSGAVRPIYPLYTSLVGPKSVALILLPVDPDGAVRRFTEHFGESGVRVATLAGTMATYMGKRPQEGIIDFSRGMQFRVLPMQDVLAFAAANDQRRLRAEFEGRPVLIGSVQPFVDRLPIAVMLGGDVPDRLLTPGVLVHAQVLRNFLGRWIISPLPSWSLFFLTLIVAAQWLASSRPVLALVSLTIGLLALLAGSTWLLRQGWHAPVAGLALTMIAVTLARAACEAWAKISERSRLRKAFGGYVSPSVLEDILRGQIVHGLGGHHFRICVMFCDIREFTGRAEQLSPDEVIKLLNRYFAEVVGAVHQFSGTVDKFLGDGMMAFFGAPKGLMNPGSVGFACARRVLKAISVLNRDLEREGYLAIRVGIGLHMGDAVVGHVGSEDRHEYTAIGDVVNVASRLQDLCKESGHVLIMSRDVVFDLPETVRTPCVSALGKRHIRGHAAVEAYAYDPGTSPIPTV